MLFCQLLYCAKIVKKIRSNTKKLFMVNSGYKWAVPSGSGYMYICIISDASMPYLSMALWPPPPFCSMASRLPMPRYFFSRTPSWSDRGKSDLTHGKMCTNSSWAAVFKNTYISAVLTYFLQRVGTVGTSFTQFISYGTGTSSSTSTGQTSRDIRTRKISNSKHTRICFNNLQIFF